MVELDQDHRTVDAVIEHTAGSVRRSRQRTYDPDGPHLVHLHPRMAIVHVAHVERDQVEQLLRCASSTPSREPA